MNRRGMTLLELVVAMAVGLLVIGVSSHAVLQSRDARDRVRAESDRLAAARAAFLLLTRDLELARAGALQIERRPGSAAPRILTGLDSPQPLLVSYRLREHALRRRERLRFAARDDSVEIAVLDDVRTFDVRCLADGEWQAAWDRPSLPEAFHVTLALADGIRLDEVVMPATGEVR